MDDSSVQETANVTNNNEEIDPLDAYMLEIDEQVQKLDKKEHEEAERLRKESMIIKNSKVEEKKVSIPTSATKVASSVLVDDEEDEEETIGKAGNFSTVEELIA